VAQAWAEVPRPETLDDTLELMRAAYEASDRFQNVEADSEEKSIRLSDGSDGEFVSYPDNLHQMLQAAESDVERQQVLDDFIAGLIEHVAGPEVTDDISMVVPVVRHRDFAEGIAEEGPVSRPLAGELAVFYVFDRPRSISYVTPTHLRDLGVTEEDLPKIAADNLARLGWSPELEGDGLWMLVFDGTYEATFLLDEGLWNGFDAQLETIIMVALARDLVIFTDAGFDGAEDGLRKLAADLFPDVTYPLSDQVFEWTGAGWSLRP
jgi:uncharacterized protein YtpQ (UPF0354 family)